MASIHSIGSAFSKKTVLAVLVIALVGGGVAYWKLNEANDSATPGEVKTTSKLKTAQAEFQDGDKRPTSSSGGGRQGGAVDNNEPVVVPPASQQKSSDSGQITLFSPSSDSTIKNGSVISGSAKVSTVYFRLVDDSVGVIAQGPLTVKDGLFSGNMQFEPQGQSGTLRVYSIEQESDREVNLVKIDVRF